MKLTRLQTSNFLGARAVDVTLTKPITLFAGRNGSGKSSLQEAVRMALTGESARVALKKDYAALVSEGAEAGFVEVSADTESFSAVIPSGKGNHADAAALPYILDAQRFAHLPANDRRAFLFGLTGLQCDGFHVGGRLTAKGCDAAKVEKIAPFLRAGFEAAQKEAQAKARECKASWKTATGGEAYGSVKATTWVATKPASDAAALAQARADLSAIDAHIETANRELGDMQARARAQSDRAQRVAALTETAGKHARIADNLTRTEGELKEWAAKVEAARAKASGARTVEHLECPCCGNFLTLSAGKLEKHVDQAVKADPEAVAALPEYERALKVLENSVANLKRDLATADAAARTLAELNDAAQADPAPTSEEIDASKSRIDVMKHGRANQQAAIRLLEEAARAASEADAKTVKAAGLHLDVQQWDAIADALAPDGIPGEMLGEALGPINERLARSSNDAGWMRIGINSDMSIEAGEEGVLPSRPYALLSESEKWRADAMIAEAVAHISGVRLLVLDRFDVLDLKGREDLLYWLDALAEEGQINTALLFGTLKAIPSGLPATCEAVWIDNGVVGLLREVA